MSDTWDTLSALELGYLIANLEINPIDLAEYFLGRIQDKDPDHLIYLRTTAKRARSEAKAARTRAKTNMLRSPLDGVPISWKDLYDTAGIPTEGGTPLLSGRIPRTDALVLQRATNAGLVCLGKTNTVQFALGGIGTNPYTGTPPNAVLKDVPRVPGGSSCGAAISVAAGLAAAGIGSDTGGSVRVPAAWNSLVGFKTSYGAIPLDGVLPLAPSLDTVGPLTRSVSDAAALFAIMALRPPVDMKGLLSLKQLRLLIPTNVVWDNADTEIENTVRATLANLSESGASIIHAPLPEFDQIGNVVSDHGGIALAEAYACWGHLIDPQNTHVDPSVLSRFHQGRDMTALDVEIVRAAIRNLTPRLYARLAGFDAMLMPTVPILPPPIKDVDNNQERYQAYNRRALRNTSLGNLIPCCAITLPLSHQIPCGLMVIAPAGQDQRLLRIAGSIEEALIS